MARPIQVQVSFVDDRWQAVIPGLDNLTVRWRSLPKLDEKIRQAMVKLLEIDETSAADADLVYDYDLGDNADLTTDLTKLRQLRSWIREREAELRRQSEKLAKTLILERGFSVRDAAVLCGLSVPRAAALAPQGKPHFGIDRDKQAAELAAREPAPRVRAKPAMAKPGAKPRRVRSAAR